MWQDFIQQANRFGEAKTPFFFLIDFEQQKPILCPLNEMVEQGIFVQFPDYTNVNWLEDLPHKTSPMPPFYLHKQPMDFATYQKGFDLVQQEQHFGNSYLLNLTYPTPIETNYSLRQLFQQSQAKYKLLFKDQFVCFSPECFVNLYDNQIFTYPMKGTIDATRPYAQATLLNNQKEQREHYTIVDLMRNDLATVAENIQVTRFRYVEEIQTERGAILQTSSEIRGELAENWQKEIGSLLAKLLPAGSISGAPKEKTVQIIQQAEQQPRGYYTGIFGIFDGEKLQSAVAIRFIEDTEKGFVFRSGGGITIQSDAQEEYQELIQKVYVPLQRA